MLAFLMSGLCDAITLKGDVCPGISGLKSISAELLFTNVPSSARKVATTVTRASGSEDPFLTSPSTFA